MEENRPVVFVSAEYALNDDFPAFAGGLGVLSADYFLEAGKQNFPLFCFSLAYHPPGTPPISRDLTLLPGPDDRPLKISLPWEESQLFFSLWTKQINAARLFLLDADTDPNPPELRSITCSPYGPDFWTMIKQQLLLGFGTIALVKHLKIEPAVYHLNEGHTAFTILGLMKEGLTADDRETSPPNTDTAGGNEQGPLNANESGPDRRRGARTSALGRASGTVDRTRQAIIVATKHTIFSASGLSLKREDLEKALKIAWPESLPRLEEIFNRGADDRRPGMFSTNKLLLSCAARANAVSLSHAQAEKITHPNSPLITITNGVNPDRWQAENIKIITDISDLTDTAGKPDAAASGAAGNGEADSLIASQKASDNIAGGTAKGPLGVPEKRSERSEDTAEEHPRDGRGDRTRRAEALWLSHEQNRHSLVEFANKTLGSTLDPQMLTVVWARRLTAYKQPELLFSDLEALGDLVQGVQFLLAGKVSPSDPHTLAVANKIKTCLSDSRLAGRVVFLPHYSLAIAKVLVSGADVWLNTPLPGKEACGTSSMKAGLNGALLLSTNDGWVAEENWTELGWILSNTDPATTLYRTLREEIIPLFYRRDTNGLPFFWLARMAKMISLCRTKYTTARMLADYKEKLYNL